MITRSQTMSGSAWQSGFRRSFWVCCVYWVVDGIACLIQGDTLPPQCTLTLRLRYVRCRLDGSGTVARERCQRMCPRVRRLVVEGIDSPGLLTLSQHLSNAPLLDTVILRSRDRSFGVSLTSVRAVEALHVFCSLAPRLRTVYMEMRVVADEEVQTPVRNRLLQGMTAAGTCISLCVCVCCTTTGTLLQRLPGAGLHVHGGIGMHLLGTPASLWRWGPSPKPASPSERQQSEEPSRHHASHPSGVEKSALPGGTGD